MTTPFDQSRYQVRFEWGVPGLDVLAPSDVVVVVDVLRFSTNVTARVDAGETVPLTLKLRDEQGRDIRVDLQVPVQAGAAPAAGAGAAHGHKH